MKKNKYNLWHEDELLLNFNTDVRNKNYFNLYQLNLCVFVNFLNSNF